MKMKWCRIRGPVFGFIPFISTSSTVPPAISCFFGAGKKRQLMAGSATYGRLRQLMTYLLWFQKIESISVDFLDFLEPKIDFMHFCDTKWREKQTGDWNSPKSNGFVWQRETIQGSLIEIAEETPRKKQKQAKMMSFFFAKNWIIL